MEIRELRRQECTAILQRRRVGRLACCSRDRPYVVPLYFAYSDRSLYAFSMVGQKIEWLRQNPFATVLVEEDEDRAWRSVIVNGSYEELPDRIGHKVTRDHAWSLLSRHADWWEPGALKPHPLPLADHSAHVFFRIVVDEMSGREGSLEAKLPDS